eukprot:Sspe_Gene.11939::Locus_4063_Transcript_1_1_Confidence_1.000_Length_1712::g.11939::m.11939
MHADPSEPFDAPDFESLYTSSASTASSSIPSVSTSVVSSGTKYSTASSVHGVTQADLHSGAHGTKRIAVSLNYPDEPLGLVARAGPNGEMVVANLLEGLALHRCKVPVNHALKRINGRPITDSKSVDEAFKDIRARHLVEFKIDVSEEPVVAIRKVYRVELQRSEQPLGMEYAMSEGSEEAGLRIIHLDHKGAVARAGVPLNSFIQAVDGERTHTERSFIHAIALVRARGATSFTLEVIIPPEAKSTGAVSQGPQHRVPARSPQQDAAREKLRREIMHHEEEIRKSVERRIDRCNGFAYTYNEFLSNYGREVGKTRWDDAKGEATELIPAKELPTAAHLDASCIGRRVQIEETGQVLIATIRGRGYGWYKVREGGMTNAETAYRALLLSSRTEDTEIIPLHYITPTQLLTIHDLGRRVQVRETGQVVQVVQRGTSFAWYKVPELEWTVAESRYESQLKIGVPPEQPADSHHQDDTASQKWSPGQAAKGSRSSLSPTASRFSASPVNVAELRGKLSPKNREASAPDPPAFIPRVRRGAPLAFPLQ